LSKLHALTTRRLYCATFLRNSTLLYVCIRCCEANSESAEQCFVNAWTGL